LSYEELKQYVALLAKVQAAPAAEVIDVQSEIPCCCQRQWSGDLEITPESNLLGLSRTKQLLYWEIASYHGTIWRK
jgi:hypothetical protein